MATSVVIGVVAKINFLAGVVELSEPMLLYLMYALSGVALGRWPSSCIICELELEEISINNSVNIQNAQNLIFHMSKLLEFQIFNTTGIDCDIIF